nr:unnamed protein product [Callosobruchus chinensis]
MLFVFHVDSGRMMTFDMSLALESVSNLKVHVQNECQIAADKQVLLISGGECLDPNKRVCSYSAGTDTNPIFLFSKQLIESPTPPSPCVDQGIDPELEKRVRDHLDMPVTLQTVVKRTQLAQRLHELAEQLLRACERLVHDQHLQQQGWSAVVANLEDITVEFRKRAEVFELGFAEFMSEREAYLSFLKYFHSDLEVLQRIPVLSVLLELDKQNLEGSKTSEENLNMDEISTGKEMTLFEWISTADSKNTMDQLYEHCAKGLETFNGKAFETLKGEIAAILLESDNNKMKEVKGLGERLFGLENLIVQVKKLVKHQGELAQSFLNNQSRASNTKDPSVLPDLCMSHKQQLQMMAQHHRDLVDIRRRIFAAKEELSVNLYHRLRWVMYVEDKILEIDHKLVIYYESLKRLRRHLEVLQQIHLAPATYLSAIAEVVRRRAFSQSFLLWASEVACHLLTIHNEEVTRRKEFQSQFDGHFLNALFPGMDDLPPSFATQAPSMFDTALPKITQEDIDRLKKELPDLADNLNVPDTTAVTNFFLTKSAATTGTSVRRSLEGNPDVAVEDKLVRAVDAVGLGSQLDRQLLLKDAAGGSETCLAMPAPVVPPLKDLERGCESETDTEEFEKVGQSPLELHFDKNLPSPRSVTAVASSRPGPTQHQDASTLTEVGFPPKKPPRCFHRSLDEHGQPPVLGHQPILEDGGCEPAADFAGEEYYIDESLPSSLSTHNSQHGEYQRQLDTANTVVALLQDNLQISRSEHEKLKSCLLKMQSLAKEATTQLKSELADLKKRIMSDIVIVNEGFFNTGTGFKHKMLEYDSSNKEILGNIKKERDVIVQELFEIEQGNAKDIAELNETKHSLQCKVEDSDRTICELREAIDVVKQEFGAKIECLEKQLSEKEVEKEKMVREVTDRLNREHKAEIENIRSRFKLMTMERSPSDTSLEKSGEFSSLSSHTTLLAQMADNFELDKEKAINEALKEEREKWEKVIAARVKDMERKFEEEKDIVMKDLARKVSEEKEKQIDVLRERERDLTLECWKHKSTIQQLTDCRTDSSEAELLERINGLQREKDQLEEELQRMRMELPAMVSSVTVCEATSKVDVQTSPIRQYLPSTSSASTSGIGKDMFTSSTMSSSSRSVARLNIDQCRIGDLVIVVWDPSHQSFRIAQDNKQMHFLHTESLDALGLAVVDGRPNKAYCVGEVWGREYCHARKSENRYKVPKGVKFFRLKVRPVSSGSWSKEAVTQSLYHPRPSMSEASRTMSQSTISEVTEGAPQSLPASPVGRDHPAIPEKEEVDGGTRKSESGSAEGDTEVAKHMEVGSWGSEGIEVHKETRITPHVEVICATDAENHFAEDSGIVESVEEGVALDETVVPEEVCAEEGQR